MVLFLAVGWLGLSAGTEDVSHSPVPLSIQETPLRSIFASGDKSIRTVLKSIAQSWRNPSITHFGQPFDVRPVSSLPIVDFEFLKYNLTRNVWLQGSANGTNSQQLCPDEKAVHAVPCQAYRTLTNPRDAKFRAIVVVDVLDNEGDAKLEHFLRLPRLTGTSRYWIHTKISRAHHQFDVVAAYVNQFIGWIANPRDDSSPPFESRAGVPRADVVFGAYELGEHTNFAGAAQVLQEFRQRTGVTLLPHENGIPEVLKFSEETDYLVSFRGRCTDEEVRGSLALMFNDSVNYNRDILVEWVRDGSEDRCPNGTTWREVDEARISYNDVLRKSKFCFLPRGHQRWTHRLAGVMSAGCIPVFIADHLTFPFAQLIPWDKISLSIPQEVFQPKKTRAILDYLRNIPDREILETRKRIHAVYKEYMSSEPRRVAAGLHSLLELMKTH